MAYSQNATITSSQLTLGNYKIETATKGTTAGGTWVNVGNGAVTAFGHNITKYDVQGRNGPDPIEGISDETFTVDFELLEYNGSVLSAIQCGAISETNTTVLSTIVGGGNSTLTPRAFKLTNVSIYSGSSVTTTLIVYNATLADGIQGAIKGDQESDPLQMISGQIVGKNDTAATTGNQLFTITRTIIP